jgi:hypothetical protein
MAALLLNKRWAIMDERPRTGGAMILPPDRGAWRTGEVSVVALAVAAAAFAVAAGVRRWWSRGPWISHTVVAAAMLGFIVLLAYWRLFGPVA